MINIFPNLDCLSNCHKCLLEVGSRPAVGSSSITISPSPKRDIAIATLLFCPPDRLLTCLSMNALIFRSAHTLLIARCILSFGIPLNIENSYKCSYDVRFGHMILN
mmetsp:Transcript_50851/g.42758  ORF Transcript_50851/g.42758 Transcript_50851/m.42758 type:complete len:106 (-) Transcript_50851:433-750(-)